MKKMKNFFDRIMNGSGGTDELGKAVFVSAGILVVLAILLQNLLVAIAAIALILYGFFRMASENTEAREEENRRFVDGRKRFLGADFHRDDDGYAYFRCPNCGQMVRVPKGKGKIEIRCPKCGNKFKRRT
ncbi:MAG: hypothetical protein U0L49_06645 [Eubacterium sp.]|nr:hypothetical protein [Eubacterium sp.]